MIRIRWQDKTTGSLFYTGWVWEYDINFEFYKVRNMTSHIYRESVAEDTDQTAKKFAFHAADLFAELAKRNHHDNREAKSPQRVVYKKIGFDYYHRRD
ncbi:MAG: hypothetical protein ABIK68_07000 [bacterium]